MTDTKIDPLDFFHSLEQRKSQQGKPQEGAKEYPGSTPPRNLEKPVDSDPLSWLDGVPFQEFEVNGETVRFYTIGALARVLGKTPVTVRSWEAKGWLPPARYRTQAPSREQLPGKPARGKRLYSRAQVVFLAEGYDKYILAPRKPNWDGFRRHIKTQYPN